ncbi:MAG: hypothetical protein ACMUIU_18605 [bacterium]
MMSSHKSIKSIIFWGALLLILFFTGSNLVMAQTWLALPPYNFLWPLWSPALSPVDPATGLKNPIVSSLYSNTVLPLQPGIAWNPIFDYPYFLYNSPVGLQYYDLLYGINPWPPSYVLDTLTGSPIPITPPVGYSFLPVTDPAWIQTNVPIANLAYLSEYPNLALAAYTLSLPFNLTGLDPWLASLIYPTPAFSSLLTAAQILGYAPVASAPGIVAPTAVVPPPTVAAPVPVAPTVVAPPPVPLTPVAPAPTVVAPPGVSVITTPAGNIIIIL